MAGLLKLRHQNHTKSNGKNLYWDRAGVDGAPFRGDYAPLMPEAEYEAKVVKVGDFQFGFFDMQVPEQATRYREVVESCLNTWFRLIHLERFWRGTTTHYVEWVEFYMEDGTRTPYGT